MSWIQRNKFTVACLTIACVVAVVLIAFVITTSIALDDNTEAIMFAAVTGNVTLRFETVFNQSQLQLEILTTLISLTDVTNTTFTQFLADLPSVSSLDASFAIAYCPVVPDADVMAHEALIRMQVSLIYLLRFSNNKTAAGL
jgi:hypothetical protein